LTLIATAIGALVALLPYRPKGDKPKYVSPDQVVARDFVRLRRSHAQLVNHIESLEREILLEQHLCAHWKEAAQRLAKQSREAREEREAQAAQLDALAFSQPAAPAYPTVPSPVAGSAPVPIGQGFCNCVPSRAQVWSEEQRRNLAAVGDRIRP
jgi:hypothetical protein